MATRPFGGAPLTFVLVWIAVIVLWAMLCAGGWWYSTRNDYSRLAIARACEAMSEQMRLADPRCGFASSAAADFAEINRKARISRLAAAGGGLVVLLIAMASRRRQQVE